MPQPANLIIFLSDDHVHRLFGAMGHPVIKTPARQYHQPWCVIYNGSLWGGSRWV